ncbi:MAG: ABC transporter ATP-binding protein [Aquabacterium sp.]
MTRGQAISLHNVTVCHQRRPAVHHVSGVFEAGSMTALVGPNGAGKSTLLSAIMGLLPVSTGAISRPIGLTWLAQQASADRHFPITVSEMVAGGLWYRSGAWRGIFRLDRAKVNEALRTVGLEAMGHRLVSDLSVGQFQRVRFARLIMQDASAILLDEPFSAMDGRTVEDLLAVIHQWHAQGRTILAVLHDLPQVRAHFPQTLLLAKEVLAWGPTDEVLVPARLERARMLASDWLDDAPWCRRPA